jgi:hypothetical protein
VAARDGLVVYWPGGIKAKNEVRSQWHHVVDVPQTILEAAGLPEPKSVDGTEQIPMHGASIIYSFDGARAGPVWPVVQHLGVRELPCAGGYRALYEVVPNTGRDDSSGDVRVLRVYGPGQDRSGFGSGER